MSYCYDALGRRISKTCYAKSELTPPQTTHFHWQGMKLSGEHQEDKPTQVDYYFYQEDSYTPLIRLHCSSSQPQIYYYHAAQNGMPVMLTDEAGKLCWKQEKNTLWAKIKEETITDKFIYLKQNLRFAGQYYDEETGLHYNTFGTMTAEAGRFTQPDPIGLMGDINLYAYTPNPIARIDLLDLSSKILPDEAIVCRGGHVFLIHLRMVVVLL